MSSNLVPSVYKWVINDTMEKASMALAEAGLDDNILQEVQQMWEQKIINMKVTGIQGGEATTKPVPPPPASSHTINNGNGIASIQNRIQQNDGVDDQQESIKQKIDAKIIKHVKRNVLQLDGGAADDDDEEDDEDENINSDLDESEEDEEEQETDNLILCQYEKVSRIKNKWKCVLKDGIINVNGKDYLFNKASGDFQW